MFARIQTEDSHSNRYYALPIPLPTLQSTKYYEVTYTQYQGKIHLPKTKTFQESKGMEANPPPFVFSSRLLPLLLLFRYNSLRSIFSSILFSNFIYSWKALFWNNNNSGGHQEEGRMKM